MALPSFHSFEQTYILFTRIYSQQVTEQTSKSKKVKPITDLDTSTLTSPLDKELENRNRTCAVMQLACYEAS